MKGNDLGHKQVSLRLLCLSVLCATTLLTMAFQDIHATVAANPQILTSPELLNVSVGQNFTVVYNLTNFANLYAWQVVTKYNGSVINLTALWIPAENVFNGHSTVLIEPPSDTVAGGDNVDGLNWTMYASSLQGNDQVSVSNGVLFSANFTVIGQGHTLLSIATSSSPVHRGIQGYYSELVDFDLISYDTFETVDCAVLSGAGNAPPTARFKVLPTNVTASGHYIVVGNPPVGVENVVVSYMYYFTVFDASASVDPDGYIAQYIWDFGDGNHAVVNASSSNDTSAELISHNYTSTGPFKVNLVVVDNGKPSESIAPAASQPARIVVMVGLVLDMYDWSPFIYTVLGIIAAVIVVQTVRYGIRIRRNRVPKTQQPKQIMH